MGFVLEVLSEKEQPSQRTPVAGLKAAELENKLMQAAEQTRALYLKIAAAASKVSSQDTGEATGLLAWVEAHPPVAAQIKAAEDGLDEAVIALAQIAESGSDLSPGEADELWSRFLAAFRQADVAWSAAVDGWFAFHADQGHNNNNNKVACPARPCGGVEGDGEKSDGMVTGRMPHSRAPQAGQMTLFPMVGLKGKDEEEKNGNTPQPTAQGEKENQPAPSPWLGWMESSIEIAEVRDAAAWRAAIEDAKSAGVCGLDTETTGLDPARGAKLAVVQLAVPIWGGDGKKMVTEDGRSPAPSNGAKAYVLPFAELAGGDKQTALESLAGLLADPGVTVVGHNLKFDLKFIRQALGGRRMPLAGLFDTMLASQLCWAGYHKLVPAEKAAKNKLKPEHPHHALADLTRRHLGFALDKGEQSSNWGADGLSPEQLRYAAWDAAVLLPLYGMLSELLRRNGLERAAELEFGCLPAVVEMELSGMWFDAARAREIGEDVATRRDAVRAKLVDQAHAAGFQARPKKSAKKYNPALNPASTEDVLECLKLIGYPVKDTSEGTLKDLSAAGCGFAADLLEFRAEEKKAAFIEQWTDKQNPADARIHPEYIQLNPNGVGRFSCREPNLQQVPARGEGGAVFRSLFRAPAGRRLVIADYSGIELRIMAWLSGDKTMIEAFQRGEDLHRLTAASIAGKSSNEVAKAERQAAKAVNFGLIYGCGAGRLVESAKYDYGVEMSYEEAKTARERFFAAYPNIARWHDVQKARLDAPEPHWFHGHEKGFYSVDLVCTRTASGRKRVWGCYGGHTLARVTELFNTPDQGTGADMLKLALARVYGRLLAEGMEDVRIAGSVHDELILEAPEAVAAEVKRLLEEEMRAAGSELIGPIPADVEGSIGESWAEK